MTSTEVKLGKDLRIITDKEIKHLLEPGELGAILELTVWDPKTGEVTERRILKSESFVQQFLQLLFVRFTNPPTAAPISIRDTGNVLRDQCESQYLLITTAGATVITHGIIIGTGAGGPTISDFAIQVIIPHATMNYSAMTYGAPAADATTSQMTLTRNFANVSGGPVTVREIALYCQGMTPDYTPRFFMIIRDVIAAGIIVPNGQTLTVNYRLQAVS